MLLLFLSPFFCRCVQRSDDGLRSILLLLILLFLSPFFCRCVQRSDDGLRSILLLLILLLFLSPFFCRCVQRSDDGLRNILLLLILLLFLSPFFCRCVQRSDDGWPPDSLPPDEVMNKLVMLTTLVNKKLNLNLKIDPSVQKILAVSLGSCSVIHRFFPFFFLRGSFCELSTFYGALSKV